MDSALTQIKPENRNGSRLAVLEPLLASAAGQSLPDIETLRSATDRMVVRKGQALFNAGDAHPFVYGVRSGLIKFCYSDLQGREWIKSFIEPGGYVGSMSALSAGGVASFSAVAMVDCSVERVPFAVIDRLANEHLPWSKAMLRLVMQLAAKKEQREHDLLTLDPAQRYAKILDTPPAWLDQISQKDLALYLGVTPVGLNRIAARLKDSVGTATLQLDAPSRRDAHQPGDRSAGL